MHKKASKQGTSNSSVTGELDEKIWKRIWQFPKESEAASTV
jgi:hypothetical protein